MVLRLLSCFRSDGYKGGFSVSLYKDGFPLVLMVDLVKVQA